MLPELPLKLLSLTQNAHLGAIMAHLGAIMAHLSAIVAHLGAIMAHLSDLPPT